ncbi:MBL fold metallo-hydrolase [Nocardioides luteus]|uniref:MBL fold metallo-hydrolase n=1 Tax=Nocardioides luteus TaxID=1844 RepID=UPI0018CB8E3A|nr:MBL fold metallo-hydrolase [Nocardioides luteus]MBG6097110.1 L-ascorbate metabolism protein UlaG (beta-lactamase superfamily) [Nocardioides luteus]
MGCQLTHIGGPTVLIELDGWRILTDPTFDPPGRRYEFGFGTSSTKTSGPALAPAEIGPIDVVLLSHDHHADNLDDRGRELLQTAGTVVTTVAGARRLDSSNVAGLRTGGLVALDGPGRPALTVRATPCRHGPPLSSPITGPVVGFALSLADVGQVALWMTGDTVLHRPLRRIAQRLDVDILLMHLGGVQFPITGPLRYSMNSSDARELIRLTGPRVSVPVHYEGWSHFREPSTQARDRLPGVTWLEPGQATDVGPP